MGHKSLRAVTSAVELYCEMVYFFYLFVYDQTRSVHSMNTHTLQNAGVGRQFPNLSSLGKMRKHCGMTRHRSNGYCKVRSLIHRV